MRLASPKLHLVSLTSPTPYRYGEQRMTVLALGADHAGFPLKQDLEQWLVAEGHTVVDVGTHSTDSVDYPDFAAAVAHAVARGDVETARVSRQHNDLNVLALGGRATAREP